MCSKDRGMFFIRLIEEALVCGSFVFVLKLTNNSNIHFSNFMKWILLLLVNFNTNTKLPHTRASSIKIVEQVHYVQGVVPHHDLDIMVRVLVDRYFSIGEF
jgi:hypothetical protein